MVVGYWIVVITGISDLEGDAPWLGFGGVPYGITISLLVALAWLLTLIGSQFAAGPLLWAVPVLALGGAWLATRVLIAPCGGWCRTDHSPHVGISSASGA
ncbi:hypothetical protein ACFSTC_57325 [Nonomuraea ferruginea]